MVAITATLPASAAVVPLRQPPAQVPVPVPTELVLQNLGALIGALLAARAPTGMDAGASVPSPCQKPTDPAMHTQAAMPCVAAPVMAAPDPAALAQQEKNETLCTLQKHMDKIPEQIRFTDCEKLAQDQSLPPDLREAFARLAKNPELLKQLDGADGCNTGDQNFSTGDLRKAFEDPALIEFNRQKAQDYTQNYIASDARADETMPRPMTTSDAAKELYLYADSLPDHIDEKALQDIVDGQCGKKCPAQLQAAAQHMLDNPSAWEKMAPGGTVSRGALENAAVRNIQFRADELAALQTIQNSPDTFFDGEFMTRDKLQKVMQDEALPMEQRLAAQSLLENQALFGFLDNGGSGHEPSRHNVTHDGKVHRNDFKWVMENGLTETNRTPPPQAAVGESMQAGDLLALNERQSEALEDMVAGMADDPALKTSRGGMPALKGFLNVMSRVLDVVKVVLDKVASVLPPGLSHLVGAVSLGVAAADKFGCEMTVNRMNGMSHEESLKLAGADFGMEALGTAMSTVPGAGLAAGAVQTVAREGTEMAVKEGVKQGVKQGVKEGLEEGVESTLKKEVKEAALDGFVDGVSTEAQQELRLQAGY